MADTFSWLPSFGVGSDPQVSLISSQFGDGYKQETPNGINYISDVFTLPFNNKSLSEGRDIIAFLRAHAGGIWFWFTDPIMGQTIKVKCKKWAPVASAPGTISLSATFEQCFDPGL